MGCALNDCSGGCTASVKVIPRAADNSVSAPEAGVQDPVWQIRLNAPAVDGKANAALQKYLAELLKLKRRQIIIKLGEKSRHKVIFIEGLSAAEAEDRLLKNCR